MEYPPQQPSFEEVAAALSPSLLRFLQRYVGNKTVADDLLQETLIRIARGLPEFAGRASVKTWALSIATRVAADYYRSPERRLCIVEVDEAAEAVDPGRLAEEQSIVDEMNACIRQVIDSLPEDYRAALVLHELEGMTAQEIAEICGASLATVKIRIHRARNRLKGAFQKQCEFYRDSDDVFRCNRKSECGTDG
jgi:RNA polymerase sigma-70 factor, ECF subfamily